MGRFTFALAGLASICTAIGACVGDDNVTPKDGGTDATVDGPSNDAPTTTDAGPDVDMGPAIDGGYAFSGHWQTFSNSGEGAESIAVIPTGGWVIGGSYTTQNALIGAYGFPAATGTRDAYVATLDSKGNPTAAFGFGGAGSDNVLSVTSDANGDVYIAGYAFNGATLNGLALTAGTFVAKLNGKNITAAPLWTHSFELTVACPTCLVVRGTDLVLATTFGGLGPATVNYDSSKSVTSQGGYDVLIVKFDASTGKVAWGGQIGGAKDDTASALAIDSARNFYVLSTYQSATLATGLALGSKVPTGPGSNYNILVAKLDSSATPVPQYALAYGDPAGSGINGQGIAVDNASHVAVAATFNGGVDFGMGATGSSGTDGVVFLLDEKQNQKTIWQQVIGDTAADRTTGVAFDAWGHVLVSGVYENTPQIGATKLADAGTSALASYIAKFGPPTTYGAEWGVGFPQLGASSTSISSVAIAIAPSGVSAIAGGFGGTADFGGGQATAISTAGTQDTFVAGRNP